MIIVLLMIIAFVVLPHPKKAAAEKRYSWDGHEIQENGLTSEQEAEIKLHCAENPNAWDCK